MSIQKRNLDMAFARNVQKKVIRACILMAIEQSLLETISIVNINKDIGEI